MSINVFTASGHIGSDMEVRYTGGGTCIGSFSLPVESGYGERKKVARVTCRIIGERAEILAPVYFGEQHAATATPSPFKSACATR